MMKHILIVLAGLSGVIFGSDKSCSAIPKQLRLVKEQLNRELESLASRIEMTDCSLGNDNDQHFERDGWELIFRATAGNDVDTYEAWVHGKLVTPQKPNNMNRACGVHYRNPKIDRWTELDAQKVKLAFFEHGKEVAGIIFNAVGSDQLNWFSKDRIVSSSWCDLNSNREYSHFSVAGDTYKGRRRRFLIAKYGGCGGDIGHTVVIDKDAADKPCLFDNQPTYPQFFYSKISTADFMNRGTVARADHLGIFIQRSGN